jgi:hypothetical protein
LQCDESVAVLTSHPLFASPSQSANPAAHVSTRHAPATHCAVALARRQRLPHAPQWFVSLAGATSQPSARSPLQSLNPARQGPAPQTPFEHVAVAPAAAGHTRPHAPQFVASADTRAS